MKWPNSFRMMLLVAVISLIASTAWTSSANLSDSSLKRIRFARGATSAEVNGELLANSTARYVLRADARQLMDVTLSAPAGVSLKVTSTSGRRSDSSVAAHYEYDPYGNVVYFFAQVLYWLLIVVFLGYAVAQYKRWVNFQLGTGRSGKLKDEVPAEKSVSVEEFVD